MRFFASAAYLPGLPATTARVVVADQLVAAWNQNREAVLDVFRYQGALDVVSEAAASALAEPVSPNWAAAITVAAAPTRRRRC